MKKFLQKVNKLLKKYSFQLIMASLAVNIVLGLYIIKKENILISSEKSVTKVSQVKDNLFDEINPERGFEINAAFNTLGPRMLSMGVIDYDKFKSTYEKSGQALSKDLDNVLTKGSNQKIKITRENSYFLLNFFWAVGLANKSSILTEGDMVKYGGIEKAGNFASTGGWTLAKENPMNYYSKEELIPLTAGQASLVEKVASSIYRPCCNNSTAFPDCNHGMALLGVLQLMAAQGANEKQMFEASKYFNAFWFPGNYYDLALYFKNKEGKSFKQIDPELILSKDYSSASGWKKTKSWLAENGLIQEAPKQGGGCGV